MSESIKINRRGVLAAHLCVAVASVSGVANASIFSKSAKWETLTHKDLNPMIGETFTAVGQNGEYFELELMRVSAVKSGWHRPINLARAEGVIADFASPQIDKMLKSGHQTVRIHHAKLGSFDLFLGAVPTRSGGHVIEAILN